GIDAERCGAVLHDAQRRLRALTHHFTELAGEDERAIAGHARRLDKENVAADRRPGEPGRDARHARAHRHFALELARAQDRGEVTRINGHGGVAAFGDAHGHMAHYPADLALEIAHAGLARVVGDDLAQRIVADLGLLGLEPIRLELAAHEIAPRDLQLFFFGVA